MVRREIDDLISYPIRERARLDDKYHRPAFLYRSQNIVHFVGVAYSS
jgi:hypothetical protein